MYQGLVDDVPSYFQERKHRVPKNYNPADWIMNVAQANPIAKLDKDGFFPKDDRELPDAYTDAIDGKDELGITITQHGVDERPPSLFVQVGMLFQREIRNIRRDTAAIGARFGLTIFLRLLIGLIFKDVGEQDLHAVPCSVTRCAPIHFRSTCRLVICIFPFSSFTRLVPTF